MRVCCGREIERKSCGLPSNLYSSRLIVSWVCLRGRRRRWSGRVMSTYQKRLKKEFQEFAANAPPGIRLDSSTMQDKLDEWRIHLRAPDGTLYAGEEYVLLFKFNSKYPFDSPQVTFTDGKSPCHPHIYSNGHICLSILDKDWSPAMSVVSVCISIQSMLSSCTLKVRPPDDKQYVKIASKNPKKTQWVFHDDTV